MVLYRLTTCKSGQAPLYGCEPAVLLDRKLKFLSETLKQKQRKPLEDLKKNLDESGNLIADYANGDSGDGAH